MSAVMSRTMAQPLTLIVCRPVLSFGLAGIDISPEPFRLADYHY